MALLSPGVQVDVRDESIYIPAAATTVPLFFIATKYGKKIGNTNQVAQGTIEAGVPRLVTSLRDSLELFGIPVFYRDVYNQPHHGDCRNEYGLLALNQFLKVGNRAYVIRANIDLDDSTENLLDLWVNNPTDSIVSKISTKARLLLNAAIVDRNAGGSFVPVSRRTLFGGYVAKPAVIAGNPPLPLVAPTDPNDEWNEVYAAGQEYTNITGDIFDTPFKAWTAYYADLETIHGENVKIDAIIDAAVQELFTSSTAFADRYTSSSDKKYNISSILSGNFYNVETRTLDVNGKSEYSYSSWIDPSVGTGTSSSTTDVRFKNILSTTARTVGAMAVGSTPGSVVYGIKGAVKKAMLPTVVGSVVTPPVFATGLTPATFEILVAEEVKAYGNTSPSLTANEGGSFYYATAIAQAQTGFTVLGNTAGADALRREEVVRKLSEVISDNNSVNLDVDTIFDTSDITSEGYEFNLILCPGYPETVDEMLVLSSRVKQEAMVIADTPMDKSPRDAIRWGQQSDEGAGVVTGGNIRSSNSGNVAYYYPHGIISNLDGYDVLCPSSALALAAMTNSDNKSNVWFAPAGPTRGLVGDLIGVTAVGYVSGTLGTANVEFKRVRLSDGMRDSLYNLCNINPIHDSVQYGIAVWGQKTRVNVGFNSSLDRINVSRMVMYIRRGIRKALVRFLMEQNDEVTRKNVSSLVTSYLYDIQIKRGLYDFAVLCDSSNNTGTTIDRNELYVNIALKPTKTVEFIYVPITLVNTGDPMTQ